MRDGYSSRWGSGAVSDDVDDPPPARGATRCKYCEKWTDQYEDDCQRCGRDRLADGE